MGVCLNTKRLILKDLTDQDLPDLQRIAFDPVVMRYVLIRWDDATQVASFLQRGIEEAAAYNRMAYIFSVRTKETGGFAGLTFLEIDPQMRSTAEVGCVLYQEYWKRGYAS